MISKRKKWSAWGSVIGVGATVGLAGQALGANANLIVSAERSQFDNNIGGPMVVQVIIDDEDINTLNALTTEPDVTINGQSLRMAQADDARWYGYFAITDQARQADQVALDGGIAGQGLDLGVFVGADTPGSVLGGQLNPMSPPPFSESEGVAVPRDGGLTPGQFANGTHPAVLPIGAGTIQASPTLNHLVRNAPPLNTDANVPVGQIGLLPEAWPMVQLFSPISSSVNSEPAPLVVQYHKGVGSQTTVVFNDPHFPGTVSLDKDQYLPGEDVVITISDQQLDLDPTSRDSWTFSVTGPTATFYQAFHADGSDDANGTLALQDLTPHLADLEFIDRGVLTLDIGPGLVLTTNDHQPVTSVTDGSTSFDQILTVVELPDDKSGVFVSTDATGRSVLRIADDAQPGLVGQITYGGLTLPIMVVPEPAGLALFAITGLLICPHRKRR